MTIRIMFSYLWNKRLERIARLERETKPRFAKIQDRVDHDKEIKRRMFMKKTMLVLALVFIASQAKASKIELIDIYHPQIVTGVFTDMKGHSDAGAAVALLTYGNWCPLAGGGTIGKGLGGPSVSLGTSLNLLPATQALFSGILEILYPDPYKFANLKAIIAPPETGTPDISMSFGPNWSYVFYDGIKGRFMTTWFYGAAWKF